MGSKFNVGDIVATAKRVGIVAGVHITRHSVMYDFIDTDSSKAVQVDSVNLSLAGSAVPLKLGTAGVGDSVLDAGGDIRTGKIIECGLNYYRIAWNGRVNSESYGLDHFKLKRVIRHDPPGITVGTVVGYNGKVGIVQSASSRTITLLFQGGVRAHTDGPSGVDLVECTKLRDTPNLSAGAWVANADPESPFFGQWGKVMHIEADQVTVVYGGETRTHTKSLQSFLLVPTVPPLGKTVTWEMAYSLRFERGLKIDFTGDGKDYEDEKLLSLVRRQALAFAVIDECDKELLACRKQ